jgi:hypothetical protein
VSGTSLDLILNRLGGFGRLGFGVPGVVLEGGMGVPGCDLTLEGGWVGAESTQYFCSQLSNSLMFFCLNNLGRTRRRLVRRSFASFAVNSGFENNIQHKVIAAARPGDSGSCERCDTHSICI